jgi:PBSX family phage terminase large subunit
MAIATKTLNPLNKVYGIEALDAGCPTDQVSRFRAADYVAQPKQLEFHAAARECDRDGGPIVVAMGGARGPGKTHATLAQAGIDDCQRIPGLKVLFLRKVQKSAAESLEDLTYRVFHKTDHTFIPSKGRITFPNGSRILLGGFNNERDIEKYVGIEYDLIVIEEITQISFEKIQKLAGSLRTSRDDWRVRMYWSTNPGGIGHLWFKESLVEPYREGRSDSHMILGGHARFIPATYRDNMFLNPEYVMWLKSLEGQLGQAWREGNWDSFEGMAFPGWDRSRHVVEPFKIPDWWVLWVAVDWGYAKPFCCLAAG